MSVDAVVSPKPHVQISLNSLYMSPVAVVQSFSDGSDVRYVLAVLWMMSYFQYHKTENT